MAILSPSRQPPLDELGWRNLLQHLLTLRSRVFTCLDQPTCYKVHREGGGGERHAVTLIEKLHIFSVDKPVNVCNTIIKKLE